MAVLAPWTEAGVFQASVRLTSSVLLIQLGLPAPLRFNPDQLPSMLHRMLVGCRSEQILACGALPRQAACSGTERYRIGAVGLPAYAGETHSW